MSKRDRAWRDYSERFRRDGFPKIAASAVALSIHSGDADDFDVKQATELGAMLLLDKPLVLCCTPGSTIPSRLRRAADVVLDDFDMADPAAQDRLAEAIKRVIG